MRRQIADMMLQVVVAALYRVRNRPEALHENGVLGGLIAVIRNPLPAFGSQLDNDGRSRPLLGMRDVSEPRDRRFDDGSKDRRP